MKAADRVAFFAFIAVLVNWHYSRVATTAHDGSSTKMSVSFDGGGLVALVCTVWLFFLLRAVYRQVRDMLAKGEVVPREVKLWAWWPLVFVPLFFLRIFYRTSQTSPEGGLAVDWGYGSNVPGAMAICFVLWMVVYQVRWNLKEFGRGGK